jgi:hypothetical protein
MNIHSIDIANLSKIQSISVILSSSENASIPTQEPNLVAENSRITLAVGHGTMNMFVWDGDRTLIWKGIVPTKTQKILSVDPEHKKVYHNDMEIPEGFGPITDLASHPGFIVKHSGFNRLDAKYTIEIVLLLIVFIILCFGAYYLIFRKTKNK